MTPRLGSRSPSFNCPRRLVLLHVILFLLGWLVWSQFSTNLIAFVLYFLLGMSASISVWVLLNPGDGILRFLAASSVCSILFISTAFAVGICFQVYDIAFGNGGNFAAMSLGLVVAGALLTIPFSLCFVLPMVLLGWLPCKMSNQTLLAPEDRLESQPMITTRTFLGIFVLVAVVMAIFVKILQVRGMTVMSLFQNTENNFSLVRNLLVLAVTFYLTWAYAYSQWALPPASKVSGFLRVASALGMLAAHASFWTVLAYTLPLNDPIFDVRSDKLQLSEVFASSLAIGFALSLSPFGGYFVLRQAGYRLCYRGKPIGGESSRP